MKKSLVAYFSASGVTKALSEKLSSAINADIYEIRPAEIYTDEDLNWQNSKSRSSIEMNDLSYRPAITGTLPDVSDCDVIFVGFPIWWYIAPTIINTFLESLDLNGKTVVPFATSGSSGMGNTNEKLTDSCKGAKLCEGRRWNINASSVELKKWAEEFLR